MELDIIKLIIEYAPNITANTILVGFSAYMLWSNKMLLKEFKNISKLIENNAVFLKDLKHSNEQLHKEIDTKREHGHEQNKMMIAQIKDELKDIRHSMDMMKQNSGAKSYNEAYRYTDYGRPPQRGRWSEGE